VTRDVLFPCLIIALLIVAPVTAFALTNGRAKTASKLVKALCWSLRIASLVPWLGVVLFLTWLAANSRDYDPDVTKWIEIRRPTESAEHEIWLYAANRSNVEWMLARRGDDVRAHLFGWREMLKRLFALPPFVPRAEQFSGGRAFHVNDGWLVGFNEGEFGAALYWFSNDGSRKYKISDDQVVDFMATPTGIIAIQGLAHLGLGEGSVVELAKNPDTGCWVSKERKSLPQAPESFVRSKDGDLFIALSDSLALLTPDNKLEVLVQSTDWVRPDTLVTSADESKIYIGTWQYVCEYDMQTKNFRYLIADLTFLNRLPKGEEERMRQGYRQ
jgi:hypothetical protein